MAKPQTRKPAAVAERRPAAPTSKVAPARRPAARPSLPTPPTGRLPAAVESRVGGVVEWARDVRTELRKVAWPTREEAAKLTAVVIAISVVVGLFLGGLDAIFNVLMQWFLS